MTDIQLDLDGFDSINQGLEDVEEDWTGPSDYKVSSDVEYAFYQEFGTRYQSGTPHVRPGVDATKAKVARVAASASDIDEFMRKAANLTQREIQSRAPVNTGRLRSSYTVSPI